MKAVFCYKAMVEESSFYLKSSLDDGNDNVIDIEEENYKETHEALIKKIKQEVEEQLGKECELLPISCNEYLAMTE